MPTPNKQTAARIYFSFSYADFKNATIIYNTCQANRIPSPIFFNEAVWNEAKNKGDGATKKLIDSALIHSAVTVFLIGRSTYCDAWCSYALRKSMENKKSIFGIHLPNQMQPGKTEWLANKGYQIYEWESSGLQSWMMSAILKTLTKAS